MYMAPNPLSCRYRILTDCSLQIQHSCSFTKEVRPRFKILSSEMLPTTSVSQIQETKPVNNQVCARKDLFEPVRVTRGQKVTWVWRNSQVNIVNIPT